MSETEQSKMIGITPSNHSIRADLIAIAREEGRSMSKQGELFLRQGIDRWNKSNSLPPRRTNANPRRESKDVEVAPHKNVK